MKVDKWKGPARIKSHLWKLAHGYLMTNEESVRRGMSSGPICPRCHLAPKSLMHLLRDCEEVKACWEMGLKLEVWAKFFSLGFNDWFEWKEGAPQ